MDAFAAVRLAAGIGFLAVAAASDLRTRKVRDSLWIALGTVGLGLLVIELVWARAEMPSYALAISAAILFYAIFFGKPLLDEDGVRLRPVRILVLAAAGLAFAAGLAIPIHQYSPGPSPLVPLASMPVMVLVYQGLYYLRLLHGGADAKALVALTLLAPAYPDAAPFPLIRTSPGVSDAMRVLFPFSFVVLVDAAILSLAVPIAYLLLNAARGDLKLPQALFGYRAELDRLPDHVWLMERIDSRGAHVLVLFPRRADRRAEIVEGLRARGVHRAWVTSKVPFMVPLLGGFALAFLAGNLLLLLFPA